MIGWVKIHRKIMEKSYYDKDSEKVHLWLHIILKANHKPREERLGGKNIICKSGQFTTGRRQLSEETGIEQQKIERMLNYFEKTEQQIVQQKTNTNRLISILNWEIYQIDEQQSEQQNWKKWTTNGQQNGHTIRSIQESKKNTISLNSEKKIEKNGEIEITNHKPTGHDHLLNIIKKLGKQ